MKSSARTWARLSKNPALVLLGLCVALLAACAAPVGDTASQDEDESTYLSFVDVEPRSVDPHCIVENYTVALNIFDRLVEVEEETDTAKVVPSLAESWERSDDGLAYTFCLREGITFSNGAALTSSDVAFSFKRLLTHPKSRHADLLTDVLGATELVEGTTTDFVGFRIIDDRRFTITLAHPAAAFLAGLTTPGASILDEEATLKAGDSFGTDVELTVGSGPFVLRTWNPGKSITMHANPSHWGGHPTCDGLKMQFFEEANSLRDLYAQGKIDILDLDMLGMEAEYFLHGDTYLKNLVRGRRVGITYLALNNSLEPLTDSRVRHALALGLARPTLLQGAAGGRGTVENGIFPRGLLGHNDELPEIPYDPAQARALLAEAGYRDGFDLVVSYPATASQSTKDLLTFAVHLWSEIGVRARMEELDATTYAARRRKGKLACYTSTFSADFNDPQGFIEAFFGGRDATTAYSLCYQDDETMQRVLDARSIIDEQERLRTYQSLEKKIVQEDFAWIPLYSKMHFFVVGDHVKGFKVSWNGWSSNRYDNVSVTRDTV